LQDVTPVPKLNGDFEVTGSNTAGQDAGQEGGSLATPTPTPTPEPTPTIDLQSVKPNEAGK